MNPKLIFLTAGCVAAISAKAKSNWTDQRPTSGSAFHNFTIYSYNSALNGSFTTFNKEDNTRGKQYLFDSWAKGTVIDINNNVIANDSFG